MKKHYFVIVALLIIFVLPSVSSAQTAEELQTQISALMAQIKSLQAQLTQVQGQSTAWCYNFNANLKVGDTGSGVGNLVTALKKEGFEIDNLEQGDSVNATFDEYTASAVSGFQQKYADEILKPLNLRYGTGYLGKSTRAKLNKLYGCGIKPSPVATPTSACNVFLTCETGYTPYNTSEKDSQNCPIIKCIPALTPVPVPSVPILSVSEQVKCVFNGSTNKQECYSSSGSSCAGLDTCVVDVKGPKSERITWKSSCGGYAYTTMDGQNEYAEFKCATSALPTTPAQTPTIAPTPTTPTTTQTPIGTSIRRFKPIDPSRCPGIIETSCTIEPANIIKVSVYDEKGGFIDTRENNNSGMAGFLNLPYGNYTVVINAEGFEYYKASFTVCAACEETTTIFLKKTSTFSTSPSITVLSPNGGETWSLDSTQSIRWTSSNVTQISLDLVNSAGSLVVKNLVNITGNPGSVNWVIPTYIQPGQYWMRVGTCSDSTVSCITTGSIDPVTIYDTSDAAFSIVAGTSGLKDVENFLASISQAVLQLSEKIKELTR